MDQEAGRDSQNYYRRNVPQLNEYREYSFLTESGIEHYRKHKKDIERFYNDQDSLRWEKWKSKSVKQKHHG
jgi:hypothetical protein